MLPFSYQVKRINIGGVVNIFIGAAYKSTADISRDFLDPRINFRRAKFSQLGVYLQPPVQPPVPWENGYRRRIQRVKLV